MYSYTSKSQKALNTKKHTIGPIIYVLKTDVSISKNCQKYQNGFLPQSLKIIGTMTKQNIPRTVIQYWKKKEDSYKDNSTSLI